MAFWSRLFRKEKKSDLELYMEQRKREIDMVLVYNYGHGKLNIL